MIYVNWIHCILNILHKFGCDQSNLVFTLADPNVQLRNQVDCEYADFDEYFPYKQVIGNICMLPWVHLDLSHVVCIVAQFYQQPRNIHLITFKHILCYLHDIIHLTFCYGGEHNINTHTIYFWCGLGSWPRWQKI
jgi:hypothetical protein